MNITQIIIIIINIFFWLKFGVNIKLKLCFRLLNEINEMTSVDKLSRSFDFLKIPTHLYDTELRWNIYIFFFLIKHFFNF